MSWPLLPSVGIQLKQQTTSNLFKENKNVLQNLLDGTKKSISFLTYFKLLRWHHAVGKEVYLSSDWTDCKPNFDGTEMFTSTV